MNWYAIPVSYTITGFIEVEARSKQAAQRLVEDMDAGDGINPVDIRDSTTTVDIQYTMITKVIRP